MSEIRFVDTTLRDGQPSLWALGTRTGAMLQTPSLSKRHGLDVGWSKSAALITYACAAVAKGAGLRSLVNTGEG